MTLPKGFVYLSEVDPTVIQDIRYAGNNNFMGRPAQGYEKPIAILTEVAAQALKEAQKTFIGLGYKIIVYDAYRPQSAVDDFWNWANDKEDLLMQKIYYPDYKDKTLLFSNGFIARLSKHSRGSAVDLSLVEEQTGAEIDMGAPFDFFGEVSHTACAHITDGAKRMRQMLKEVMESHGFDNYRKEWWHYEFLNEPFPRKPEDHFNFPVK
ncbi:MAG: peptidase [Candidatus Midichloriaceae bacterium]|jgi:D-alanyl-D-alanine dipeptidase|nr:peptidase [Candidatus Midichloriaceae bacterium]